MAAGRLIVPQFFPAEDSNGSRYPYAKLWTYEDGTTTLKATYTTEALTTLNPNPVIANAGGQFPPIWATASTPVLDAERFTVAIWTQDGEQLASYDGVSPTLDVDTAAVVLAETASDVAEQAASDAEDALTQIEQIVVDAATAPSVVRKSDKAATKSDMQSLSTSTGQTVVLSGRTTEADGGGGNFAFLTGDQSALVTADPQQIRTVPPAADPTGASGVFYRSPVWALQPKWAGLIGNGTVNDATAMQALIDFAYGRPIDWTNGTWRANTAIVMEPNVGAGETSKRNQNWRGVGMNVTGVQFTRLSSRVSSGACFRFSSMLFSSWEDMAFSGNTPGPASILRLDALDNPAFAGSVLELNRVSVTVPTGGVSDANLIVENVKNVRLALLDIADNSDGSGTGIRVGQDESVVPGTFQDGGVGRLAIENLFSNASVDLRHAFNVRISESNITNAGCIISSGDSRAAGVFICTTAIAGTSPSTTASGITTADYVAANANEFDGGCYAGLCNTVRDRDVAYDIVGQCSFWEANHAYVRDSGEQGFVIRAGADRVHIGITNDPRTCFANGNVFINDERTGALTDQFIYDGRAAADAALGAVGSWTSVLSGSTHRPYRGGKLDVRHCPISITNNDASAVTFAARIQFNGTTLNLQSKTIAAGATDVIDLSIAERVAALAATWTDPVRTPTVNSTVAVQVNQPSGTAATIRGISGTVGRTFCQIEELP